MESIVSQDETEDYVLPPAQNVTYHHLEHSPHPTQSPPAAPTNGTPRQNSQFFASNASSALFETARGDPTAMSSSMISAGPARDRSSLCLPLHSSHSSLSSSQASAEQPAKLKGPPGATPTTDMPQCKRNALKGEQKSAVFTDLFACRCDRHERGAPPAEQVQRQAI